MLFALINFLTSAPVRSEIIGSVPVPAIVMVIMHADSQFGQTACAMTAIGISLIGTTCAPSKLLPQL